MYWPSSSSKYGGSQPPRSKPSLGSSCGAPGLCITPSMVTKVVAVSRMDSSWLDDRPIAGLHPRYERAMRRSTLASHELAPESALVGIGIWSIRDTYSMAENFGPV